MERGALHALDVGQQLARAARGAVQASHAQVRLDARVVEADRRAHAGVLPLRLQRQPRGERALVVGQQEEGARAADVGAVEHQAESGQRGILFVVGGVVIFRAPEVQLAAREQARRLL